MLETHLQIADTPGAANGKRRPSHAQETRTDAAAAHGDERRNFQMAALVGQLVCNHRPVAGVLDIRIRDVPRVHVVTATRVVGLARAHRSNDGQRCASAWPSAASVRKSARRRWY